MTEPHKVKEKQRTYHVESLGFELDRNTVHSLAYGDNETTMDDELGEFSTPFVAVSTMPDEQFRQMAELFDGEIRCETGLSTFFANNTHAHIGGLNHGDIIATIANAADSLLGVLSDKLGNFRFLGWRATTGNNGGEKDSD